MSQAQSNTEPCSPLDHLNDSDFEGIKTWLRRALRDEEPLPRATPDEPPDVAIHRADQTLRRSTREDLREACIALSRDFARTLVGDRNYLAALLGLAWWFRLEEAADALYPLVLDRERFTALDLHQQQQILLTLNDFEKELPMEFWWERVKQDNWTFASPAFLGLLLHGPDQALQILPSLSDDEHLGNLVACVLENYWEDIDPAERVRLLRKVEAIQPSCKENLVNSLSKWIAQHDHSPFGD